jgi:methylase of polypeptide subunit release factors
MEEYNPLKLGEETYMFHSVAEKNGYRILVFTPGANQNLPDYHTRLQLDRKITRLFREHLLIFCDKDKTKQIWQLFIKQTGKPTRLSETHWNKGQEPELLYQKASRLFFTLDEEDKITITDVVERIHENFSKNVEKVTRQFYDNFRQEHRMFIEFIKGIPADSDREWYASLMLNRLMFCYFIQKKGFLDNNLNYLKDKLSFCQKKKGMDTFYVSFYKNFLLALFHEGLGTPAHSEELKQELGKIPYLNGGLFDVHELEKQYADIDICDEAFAKVFAFFDDYHWHLDTRISASGKDINPDVIGYIFEKYINERAKMGAYYTKEDITDYISKNCIIPYLFDETQRRMHLPDYEKQFAEWVKEGNDDFIYDAVKKGANLPFPPEIEMGIDTTQPNLLERRKEWNKPAPEEYALPTEIWREVVERRQRYQEVKAKMENNDIRNINDFITYNLNIRQFAQNVIETTTDADFIRHFYKALNSVTILDPTCGSGAFLFAAMNILEPLYESCIIRMRAFVEDEDRANLGDKHNFRHKFKFFRDTLQEIQAPEHPNLPYFIYKSIILRNLYGVDIMKEAVEIAKLRLFLKLVSTVDVDYRKQNFGLEPLPDIDFNIKAGNTLIGFAMEQELKLAYEGKFDFDDDTERIKEKCDVVAKAFSRYKNIQLAQGEDFRDFKTAKDELNKRVKELNEELSVLLSKQYGVDYNQAKGKIQKQYNDWLQSHQPFHWFAEFYEIIHDRGGFDVIIGNPPYVEYPTAVDYRLTDYTTISCGNLYAYVLEKASLFSNENTKIGQIVPVSIISTPGYKTLRKLFLSLGLNYISSYNIHPCCLFEGANPRLAIVITHISKQKDVYISGYQKWYADERDHLFFKLFYNHLNKNYTNKLIDRSLPKIQSNLSDGILNKFIAKNKKISNYFEHAKHSKVKSFFYRRAFGAFVLFYDFIPDMFDENGKKMMPTELKELRFQKKFENLILSLYYSNLYYFSTYTFSDCRNINKPEIEDFYIDLDNINMETFEKIEKLSKQVHNDLYDNSVMMEYNYKSGKRTFQAFYPRFSKIIFDEIDKVLAEHYGFTEEELDFIINYDIKYRMGKEMSEL